MASLQIIYHCTLPISFNQFISDHGKPKAYQSNPMGVEVAKRSFPMKNHVVLEETRKVAHANSAGS